MSLTKPQSQLPLDLDRRLACYCREIERKLTALRQGKLTVRVPSLIGLYRRPPGAHFHAAPELFIQLGGVTVFECPGGSLRLSAGEICVMPRGVPHGETRINHSTPFRVMVCGHVSYGFSVHQTLLAPDGALLRRPADYFESPRGRNGFKYLDEIASVSTDLSVSHRRRFVLSSLEVFLLTLLGELKGEGQKRAESIDSSLVTEAEKLVRWKIAQPDLSVAMISTDLGVSADHLSREFRRMRGVTLKTWIITERLALARSLLVDRGCNIAEVGYACGFKSAAYFVYLFRRRTGLTPRSFRLSAFRK